MSGTRALSPSEPVRPLDDADPVGAVVAAHRDGLDLALPTSGTTGPPGLVVRTTASWWASFPAYADLSGVAAGRRLWLPGPLASTMNLLAAVHARDCGAEVVADAGRADRAVLTPAVLERHLDRLRPGTRVVVAGAALEPALADRAEDAGLEVAHYYGAAELSFVACGRDAGDLRAFPGVEISVHDGAIRVRSPYVATSGPALRTRGGWSGVGDLGAYDGTRLTVLGRPDALTTAGATVVLAEVERALATGLAGPVVCFAVPHAAVGELLVAAVLSPADLAAARATSRTLPAASRPRSWLVLDRLPLTAAGKTDRAALRTQWRRRHPAGADAAEV